MDGRAGGIAVAGPHQIERGRASRLDSARTGAVAHAAQIDHAARREHGAHAEKRNRAGEAIARWGGIAVYSPGPGNRQKPPARAEPNAAMPSSRASRRSKPRP